MHNFVNDLHENIHYKVFKAYLTVVLIHGLTTLKIQRMLVFYRFSQISDGKSESQT